MLAHELVGSLVERRRAKGVKQAALAARIGVDRRTLTRWERRRIEPRLSSLIAWAEELGLDVDLKVNRRRRRG